VRSILRQEIGWFDTCGANELSTRVAELCGQVKTHCSLYINSSLGPRRHREETRGPPAVLLPGPMTLFVFAFCSPPIDCCSFWGSFLFELGIDCLCSIHSYHHLIPPPWPQIVLLGTVPFIGLAGWFMIGSLSFSLPFFISFDYPFQMLSPLHRMNPSINIQLLEVSQLRLSMP
jgi:hypothetical protein